MIFIYLICFIIIAVAIWLLLGLTPDKISDDIMRLTSPEPTLRDRILTAKGQKKSRKLIVELNRIRDALIKSGKGNIFALLCSASLILMIVGCVLAMAIDNIFLIPVFSIALAMIPFLYAKKTIDLYEKHISEELETTLSIITSSYLRSDDIIGAVRENISYLKPPVKEIFAEFLSENIMITANIKQSILHLKEKISNTIFGEWCDALISCQDDRTLKDTLLPIVAKFTDVRQANNEIKGVLSAARVEYYMMAGMVVANIPLLYVLNRDWYNALMNTVFGKIVLAICGFTILVSYFFMKKYTKPITFRK